MCLDVGRVSPAGRTDIRTMERQLVELPQLISFDEQAAPINCASNVRTIFVNEAPRPSVVFQPPAPPPPPPVIAEVVNDGRLVNKIAIPRLRLEKKKKKVRKTYTRTKPFVKGAKKGKIIIIRVIIRLIIQLIIR